LSGLVALVRPGAPRAAGVNCGGRRESGKCGEEGIGMGVTHWHPGEIAAWISSADRKAVRIAQGYLRFITEACRAGRAGREGTTGRSRVRHAAGQVGGWIPVRRARPH
jgi:hypothetical protein